jgi:hypothetical protein
MASASQASSQNSALGITYEILAGSGHGITKYANEIGRINATRTVAIKNNGKNCVCLSVALSLIAMIAVGCAATLIAMSGGPSNALLFYTGVAFGGLALGLSMWIIGVSVKSVMARKEQNKAVKTLKHKEVPEKEVLLEMEKATSQQIVEALKTFSAEQRQGFIQHVDDSYFSQENNKKELTEEQKKVLSVFAHYPPDLYEIDTATLSREFALHLLAHINPNVLDLGKGKGTELMSRLFLKVGVPKLVKQHKQEVPDPEEIVSFSRHPRVIARLAQNQEATFTPELVRAIFSPMDINQKTLFLKTLADDISKLASSKNSEKETIVKVVTGCIFDAFSADFVAHFNKVIAPEDQEAVAAFNQAEALLEQLAKWPDLVALPVLFLLHKSNGKEPTNCTGLLNALYEKLGNRQDTFIHHAANNCSPDFNCAYWINKYAADPTSNMPSVLKRLFARLPVQMARATGHLDDARTERHALAKADEIFVLMNAEDKIAFLNEEKLNKKGSFKQRMTKKLKEFQTSSSWTQQDHVVTYLRQNPAEFKELVLENEELGNHQARATLALNILEHIGQGAEQVINVMDNGSIGFPYFNFLANMLIDQTKDLDLNRNPVRETRARLIARFKYAPKMALTRDKKLVWGGAEWKLKADGSEWENFKQIAANEQKNVWKT